MQELMYVGSCEDGKLVVDALSVTSRHIHGHGEPRNVYRNRRSYLPSYIRLAAVRRVVEIS